MFKAVPNEMLIHCSLKEIMKSMGYNVMLWDEPNRDPVGDFIKAWWKPNPKLPLEKFMNKVLLDMIPAELWPKDWYEACR